MEPSAVNRLRKSSQISRMCHNFRSTRGQSVQLMWSRLPKEAPTMGVSACSVLILLLQTYQMKAEVNSTGFSLRCPSSSLSHAGPPYLPKSPSTLSPFTLTALSAKFPTLWDSFFLRTATGMILYNTGQIKSFSLSQIPLNGFHCPQKMWEFPNIME